MALMEILDAAQDGAFYDNAGAAAGLTGPEARDALGRLCPEFAAALMERAKDPEHFESLLDLLEDGEQDAYLDDPAAIADPEALEDGNAILADLYGSKTKALAAVQDIAGAGEPGKLMKIAAIGATSVLAVLARANKPQQLASAEEQPSQGGGLLGTIVSALVEGALKGAQRSLAPRRRRRYSNYYGTRRRRTTRRKRPATTLESIFKEILGTGRR